MNKFIVLEGLDGCGKTTQLEKLCERLSEDGFEHKRIKLPDYNGVSSGVIKQYLAGEFKDITPYASSLLYTVDRIASYEGGWKRFYEDGVLIVADRYTSSNIIFQMTKLPKDEWSYYIDWLTNLEFNQAGLPAPDKVIFLDMPVEVSQRLMSERYDGDESKKDIHEANIEYLEQCREAALYAAEALNWAVIPCAKEGKPLSIEEISDKIYDAVLEV